MLLQKKSKAKSKNADIADSKKKAGKKSAAPDTKDKKIPSSKDNTPGRSTWKSKSKSEPKLERKPSDMNVSIIAQTRPSGQLWLDDPGLYLNPHGAISTPQIYHALPQASSCSPHMPCSQSPSASTSYIHPPPPVPCAHHPHGHFHSVSTSNIPTRPRENIHPDPNGGFVCPHGTAGYMNQGAAVFDRISTKMNAILNAIDGDEVLEEELDISQPHPLEMTRSARLPQPRSSKPSIVANCFSKAWTYANSRLPPHLPPFKVYMPTYPLLTLAARYSLSVYQPQPPSRHPQRHHHVAANTRLGTKAMTLTTQNIDARNTIALSVRGSATFADWAVNFRPAPTAPTNFLDDAGNLCHAGFLHVARAMISPIAEHLRSLLEDQDSRTAMYGGRRDRTDAPSLLICGHSAGGAVAALLYSHMLSTQPSVSSELKDLAPLFKRIHCITFGAPPVSLLPLQTPPASHTSALGGPHRTAAHTIAAAQSRARKSLFFAFINEGDPVVRAEMAYAKSLIRLYAAPLPGQNDALISPTGVTKPEWPVPQATLSCAGRLVLLRSRPQRDHSRQPRKKKSSFALLAGLKAGRERDDSSDDEDHALGIVGESNTGSGGTGSAKTADVQACLTSDEELRGVVFGDPRVHGMRVYKERVEALAVGAVMGEQ